MPKKKPQQKTTADEPQPPGPANSQASPAVKVRMYRQGLGDCFLITLPRKNGNPYSIMIDCGVILGTADAGTVMSNLVNDIISTTGGHIDLLLATHEHWDHLSGFLQAKDLFGKGKLEVDRVWLGWTEDPDDALASKLRAKHQALRMALASACARMRLDGAGDASVDALMEFFGAAGQGTTEDALEFVKKLCAGDGLRFCRPTDDPVNLPEVGARLYILGPPHDEKLINKCNPSKSQPETYGMADLYLDTLEPAITEPGLSAPFDPILQIPLEAARQMPFFRARYWGEDADSVEEKDQSWRRIDGNWLDISSSLALQLDSATNNTSLVLAIELGSGDVLLFAADAQVGNWISWQDLKWTVDGKEVTGPDLLERTVLYKVGHHGSHNATLRQKGLELMKNLKIALIPVDRAMALKKRWGNMPLDAIEQALNAMTKGCVLRIDRDIPPSLSDAVTQDASKRLYYEVTL